MLYVLGAVVFLIVGIIIIYSQVSKLGTLKINAFSEQQNKVLMYNMSGDLFDFHFVAQYDKQSVKNRYGCIHKGDKAQCKIYCSQFPTQEKNEECLKSHLNWTDFLESLCYDPQIEAFTKFTNIANNKRKNMWNSDKSNRKNRNRWNVYFRA